MFQRIRRDRKGSGRTIAVDRRVPAASPDRDAPSTAHSMQHSLTTLQRRFGNQYVGNLLEARRDASDAPTLQRREDAAVPARAIPAAATATPVEAPASTPTNAGTPHTTVVTFTAIADEVAGTGKNAVKTKEADDALWFDPLNIHSETPLVTHSIKQVGVLAGSGEQVVATVPVPVTGTDPVHGSGAVTARLKYANVASRSFDVSVTGTKDIHGATKAARTLVEEAITTVGDIPLIQQETSANLVKMGYADAVVTIRMQKSQTKDIGETSFYYLARHQPQIQMRISSAKVGETKSTYSGTVDAGRSTSTDTQTHRENSRETTATADTHAKDTQQAVTATESVNIEYQKSVVKTLDDKVRKVETARTELISKLSDVVVDDEERHETETTKQVFVPGTYEDYTKNVKGHTEEGDRKDANLAAKAKKLIGIAKDVISIPYIDKIPGVGKLVRKLKGWELDLAEDVLGVFAEEGTVHYKDTTEDTAEHRGKGGSDTTTGTKQDDSTSKSKSDRKRELSEAIDKQSQSDWSRYKKEVEDTKEKYSSSSRKDGTASSTEREAATHDSDTSRATAGGSERKSEAERKSVTATFTTATTWVISKPVVEAAVVAGDGEVSGVPFREAAAVPAPAPEAAKPVQ